MTRNILTLLAIGLAGSLELSALDIAATPGAVKSLIAEPATVDNLAVEGQIDATDLYFIGSELTALQSLDLSKAQIVAYEGESINHATAYPANHIPAASLAGSPLGSIAFPDAEGLSIGHGAFAGSGLRAIDLASDAVLGDGAFAGCPNLELALVGSSEIGQGAFANCGKLKDVVLRGLSVAIDDNAFANCPALARVDGAYNVSTIGRRAFAGCKSLENFEFGTQLTSIGDEAFTASGLRETDLSGCGALKSVGDWAFAGCAELTAANLGNAAGIGEGAFFDCPRLEDFTAAEGMTEVPAFAFAKDTAVDTKAIIGDNTTSIDRYALSHVTGASVVDLPESLVSIGDHAMEYMSALNTINAAGAAPAALGQDVWEGVDVENTTVYVPEGAEDAYKDAEQWRDFTILAADSNDLSDILDIKQAPLRARFVGKELQVSIQEAAISRLDIYDPTGRLLVALAPDSELVSVDTSAWNNDIFLIVASLSDKRHASLKISR